MRSGELEALLRRAVESGVTPGGVLQVGDGGRPILSVPFGKTQSDPPEAGTQVTEETVYDVASLTKVVATTSVLLKLCETGDLDLDTPAKGLLPLADDASEVTVRQLAGHTAGYPAHVRFYDRLLAGEILEGKQPRDAMVRMAAETPLEAAPGSRALYSDVGFILLGALLERAGGARLDELTRRYVTEPLSMARTRFVDLCGDPLPAFLPGTVAPTERCPRRGLLIGEVHDDNAHAAGGICGHAGLFSTAPDLGRFAAAMCDAFSGDGAHFDPDLVKIFFGSEALPGSTRRIGWEVPSPDPGVSHAGELWPRDGVGHLGFTGCSLWLDPPHRRWVVLLTNRVHPDRDKQGIKDVRRAVMDAASRSLGERDDQRQVPLK